MGNLFGKMLTLYIGGWGFYFTFIEGGIGGAGLGLVLNAIALLYWYIYFND